MDQVPRPGPATFTDLFDLAEVQAIQDAFALAAGVASIVVDPGGCPLTRPSNFTHLCGTLVRATEAGRALCMHSDRIIGPGLSDGPIVRPCLTCGLWDGGARIAVGKHHLASWLVGQVRDDHIDVDRARAHAREIGIDEDAFLAALVEVPVMPREQFEKICQSLYLFATLLSRQAARNVELHRVVVAKDRAEAERDQLEDHLRQAAKLEALGRLAGGVAHDFNNLLTAIRGYGEILATEIVGQPEASDTLQHLLDVTTRAADVVRGLLDFSRKEKQRSEPVPINAMVSEVAGLLAHSVDRRITVILDLDADEPVVFGDRAQIQNAILNLAINARDAMPQGGDLTITTCHRDIDGEVLRANPHMETVGRYLEIRVADTGTGMDDHTRDHIFEPFFTTKPAGVGTGLGLSGVYGCVKSHRGGVEVQSEAGRGTTVAVLLPLAVGPIPPAPAAAIAPALCANGERSGRVLVVDDEDPVRDLVVRIFQRAGYEVAEARDGVEALELHERASQRFDLVVLDLVMPRLAGDEALRTLLSRDPCLPVLAMSGGTDGDPAARMLGAGARAFVAKPFRPGDLLDAASQVMAGGRPARETTR